jgi:hypothetical protein
MNVEFSRQIFAKSSKIKFHKNPSSRSRVFPYGQADRYGEANSLARLKIYNIKPTGQESVAALLDIRKSMAELVVLERKIDNWSRKLNNVTSKVKAAAFWSLPPHPQG